MGFPLKDLFIRAPNTIREIETMDLIPLSPNDSLSMEESCIFVSQLNPLLPRFLKPKKFLLEEDVIVIMLETLLKVGKVEGINSL